MYLRGKLIANNIIIPQTAAVFYKNKNVFDSSWSIIKGVGG